MTLTSLDDSTQQRTSSDGSTTGHNSAAEALAQRLSDPQVAASLNVLLDHADLIALMVESLDQFIGRSEIIGGSLAAAFTDLKETVQDGGQSVDLQQMMDAGGTLAKTLPSLAPKLADGVRSGTFDRLVATGEVAAQALPQVELLAGGLVAGSKRFPQDAVEVKGPMSLLRMLKDPDITRALSFLATVAQSVGRELANPPAPSGTSTDASHPASAGGAAEPAASSTATPHTS